MSKIRMTTFALFAIALLEGCTGSSAIKKEGAKLNAENNPKQLGIALEGEAAAPVMLVSVPKTVTGEVVLCQSKTRIVACKNANVHTLVKRPDAVDRSIYAITSTIDPEGYGKFFAVEVNSEVVLRFRLRAADGSDADDPNEVAPTDTDTPPTQPQGETTGLTANEVKVIELINNYRRSINLGNCKLNATLNEYAKDNSARQQRMGYSGHFAGNSSKGAAEIAFYGPTTPESTFQGWRASGGHDAIMRTGYRNCGVSAGTSGYSWTVTFQ